MRMLRLSVLMLVWISSATLMTNQCNAWFVSSKSALDNAMQLEEVQEMINNLAIDMAIESICSGQIGKSEN